MKKVVLTLIILSIGAYAGNYSPAKVHGCIAYMKTDMGENWFSLRGTSFSDYPEYSMIEVGGYKVDNKNKKTLLKAWKRCNK